MKNTSTDYEKKLPDDLLEELASGKVVITEETTTKREIKKLIIHIALDAAIVFVLFFIIYGLHRNTCSMAMQPSINEGDLIMYQRINKTYDSGDAVLYKYNDDLVPLRVVAVAGDKVDISGDVFMVNGYPQSTNKYAGSTHAYKEGVRFPLTIKRGEVFLLADSRENATDSRIFGPVKIKDLKGKIISLYRIRGI